MFGQYAVYVLFSSVRKLSKCPQAMFYLLNITCDTFLIHTLLKHKFQVITNNYEKTLFLIIYSLT